MFYSIEHGHGFSIGEGDDKRNAFADDLTQPQQLFLFHAKEQRKKMRREDSPPNTPGKVTQNTTHIT